MIAGWMHKRKEFWPGLLLASLFAWICGAETQPARVPEHDVPLACEKFVPAEDDRDAIDRSWQDSLRRADAEQNRELADELRRCLALLYQRQGRIEDALELQQKSQEIAEHGGARWVRATEEIAALSDELGNADEAEAAWRSLIDAHSENTDQEQLRRAEFLGKLALHFKRSGQYRESIFTASEGIQTAESVPGSESMQAWLTRIVQDSNEGLGEHLEAAMACQRRAALMESYLGGTREVGEVLDGCADLLDTAGDAQAASRVRQRADRLRKSAGLSSPVVESEPLFKFPDE